MPLSSEAVAKLRSLADKAVQASDDQSRIPGTTVVVVDKTGAELFAHSAGRRGLGSGPEANEPMTLDSIFWIASCTKMVTAVACMQLVEKSMLRLDDAAQIEGLCPELAGLKVVKRDAEGGKPRYEDKKNGITLRMLLTHTAGFGYSFFNEELKEFDEFAGRAEDVTKQPLLFQPGEGWQYSIGLDWAGFALERVTGQKLNDYVQEHICQPLGLKEVTMFPTASMKQRAARMHQRAPDGKLSVRDHLVRSSLKDLTSEEIGQAFHSGGAGLFARPQEYCQILATLLNDGTSPTTGAQLLKKETVAEMFRNQIPQFPDFGRQGIGAANPELTNPVAEIYPTSGNKTQGWGLSFMISGGDTGRADGTVMWAGLPNCWWWCDRESGVAGIVCSQILPFGDPAVLRLWFGVETVVYRDLQAGQSRG